MTFFCCTNGKPLARSEANRFQGNCRVALEVIMGAELVIVAKIECDWHLVDDGRVAETGPDRVDAAFEGPRPRAVANRALAGKAGATSSAITSHLDLLPTFVGLTGLPDAKRPPAVKALPGHDFSALLADPEKASLTAVRPAALFNYVGPSTVDGDYLGSVMSTVF